MFCWITKWMGRTSCWVLWSFYKKKGCIFFQRKKTILRQARCWCLWCILLESHLCYLILDVIWTFVFLSLSLSMWDRLPFQFWHLCLFVLHLTISSNFEIWLDLIPLISYNWSLASFFLPKQSHTHNFTTIPKRHLNPNPKKIPPKSFTPPLGPKFNQPSTIHQPITNPSTALPSLPSWEEDPVLIIMQF